MPKHLNDSIYNYDKVNKIRKEFERRIRGGNLMQYTYWLEKRILRAEKTIREYEQKVKKCSIKIQRALQE